jgi:hypothetical protein
MTEIVPGRLIETYREPGPNSRSVGVTLHADGSVGIDQQDMGPVVEQCFGDSDYERWTIVPALEVGRLAAALLVEKFGGRGDAVDAFSSFCREHGIAAQGGSY